MKQKIIVEIEIGEKPWISDESVKSIRYDVKHVDEVGDRLSSMGIIGSDAAGALFAVAKIIQTLNAPFEYKSKE